MKTLRTAAVIALALALSISASAQEDGYIVHTVKWFEDINSISAKYGVPADVIISVNNLQSAKLSARQELLIPKEERFWNKPGTTESQETAPESISQEDSLALAARLKMEAETPAPTDSVKVGLVLPFSSYSEAHNGNSLDFYSGVLMAVRDMGETGLHIDLDVRDISQGVLALYGMDSADFILGPIRSEDISEVSAYVADRVIISPLDPKAEEIAKTSRNIIQAPTRSAAQFTNAIKWAEEIHRSSGESISPNYILVSSSLDPETEREATEALNAAGIRYHICSCGVQGDISNWGTAYNPLIQNFVIIAISNEAALNNAVRNMSIEVAKENVITFTGSKIRAYSSIPLENIHRAGIHAVCSYYVDYSDAVTLRFIEEYKRVFRTSPSQFAFQGYDLATYAIKTFAAYGRKAWRHMVENEKVQSNLLQTSIKLVSFGGEGGLVNDGVRRVEYRQDYSTVLAE